MVVSSRLKLLGLAVLGPLLLWGAVLIALRYRSGGVRTYTGEPSSLGDHSYFPEPFTTAELVLGFAAQLILILWLMLRRSFRDRVYARSYAAVIAMGIDLFLLGCSVAALPHIRHPDSGRALIERSESIYYASDGSRFGFHHYEAYRPIGDLFASSLAYAVGALIAISGITLMLVRSGLRVTIEPRQR